MSATLRFTENVPATFKWWEPFLYQVFPSQNVIGIAIETTDEDALTK
jgi:hypothetical protein